MGGGPCGVVVLSVRRLCTDLVPKRDLTELDCLRPNLDLTPVLVGGGGGCLNISGMSLPYSSLPTGGPKYPAQRVVRPVLVGAGLVEVGLCCGKGSGRCETKLDLRSDELAELALLDVDEVEGVGDLKVTLLAAGGEAS